MELATGTPDRVHLCRGCPDLRDQEGQLRGAGPQPQDQGVRVQASAWRLEPGIFCLFEGCLRSGKWEDC